jgi:hypothetical protein
LQRQPALISHLALTSLAQHNRSRAFGQYGSFIEGSFSLRSAGNA